MKEIKGGIYPYIGVYMNRRTKKVVKEGMDIIKTIEFMNENAGDTYRDIIFFSMFTKEAKTHGFTSFHDMVDNLVPTIPKEIEALCEYTNLFVDNETIYDMKPILYVYWA